MTLLTTIYVMCGKVNFTNLSRYSELSERTYRRHFDEPYAFMALNRETIALAISPTHFQVGAIDASFVEKSGKATYGLDYFHNGKAGRSERGLEISMIAVIDVDTGIGYTLSVQQTPVIEKTSERTRVDAYLEHLCATVEALPGAVRHLVGDGFYSKRKWVDGVMNSGLEAIGKLRHDANLRYLYHGSQKQKGARRKYDGKVFLAERSRWRAHGNVDPERDIYLYSATVWAVSLKRKIQVVYLINCKHPERPCFALLFSTDLELEPVQIYRAYKARFQVEFIFRDAKQFTGLTDCQARDAQKLDFHFNASLTALNLAKYEQFLQRDSMQSFVFSMASYKRRKLNQHLLERFIHNLDLDETWIKSHHNYRSLCEYGVLVS